MWIFELSFNCMKKVLEVLQCSNGELKFNTDLDVKKNPMVMMDITTSAIFSMATKLWGGNEQTVIAAIRALFVADMALSPDRDVVLKGLGEHAAGLGGAFTEMMMEWQSQGKAQAFGPGVPKPSKKRPN